MIRVAVLEDNLKDYERLKECLLTYEKSRGETQLFTITHFPTAAQFFETNQNDFDLVFIDIVMPNIDGMQAAKGIRKLDESVAIVFVTSMPQYAIEGYNVKALYYIVKPLKYADFAAKCDNIVSHIEQERKNNFIILEPPFEKRKVLLKNIKYIEIFAHDVVVHLFKEDIHVRGTLVKFEKLLDPKKFCRISSCYIVNLSYVTAVKNMYVYIDDIELKMSYSRKNALIKALADSAARL